MISALNSFVKIASVIVAIYACQPVRLLLCQEIYPLVGLEMVFHPKLFDLWR